MKERVCDALPTILMVVVQFAFAGVNIFYKLAVADGMNLRIIVAYRFFFASVFMLPLAFFLPRGRRPKLTWWVVFYAFLSGLFAGSLTQNLYVESMALTSATFASAISNLTPAITFIFAISFRLEKLNIGTVGGKAKVVGTVLGLGGAMLLTFYKGAELKLWSTHVDLLHDLSGHVAAPQRNIHSQLFGSLMGLGDCFAYALWLIVQAKMNECYPCHYTNTAMMCLMATIQAVGFALCVERRWSQWKLGWNARLLSVSYMGIVASGAVGTLISWCVKMKGPMFVSVFSPLTLVLVAIAGSLFLEERLHLGCLVGGILIVCALYIVLWGKSKEMKKITQLAPIKGIEDEHERVDLVISPITIPLPKIGTHAPDFDNTNN